MILANLASALFELFEAPRLAPKDLRTQAEDVAARCRRALPKHVESGALHYALGLMSVILGAAPSELRPHFERAYDLGERGFSIVNNLASSLTDVGEEWLKAGRDEEARPLFEKTLRICQERQAARPDEPLTALHVAIAAFHLGERELCAASLAIAEKSSDSRRREAAAKIRGRL